MAKIYPQYAAIAGSLVPIAKTPLDNRLVVEYITDLTNVNVWKADDGTINWYLGMVVSVLEDNKTYKLLDNGNPAETSQDNYPATLSHWGKMSDTSDFHLTRITLNGENIVVVNNLSENMTYSDPFAWGVYEYGNMED